MKNNLHMWYRQSAAGTNEALPLGNGKLTALVYGGTNLETVQLDESTFWSGKPSDDNNRADTPQLLQTLRGLLLKEDYDEADRLGHDYIGVKNSYGTHMPFGNLMLRHERLGPVAGVERGLSLTTGLADTTIDAGGTKWRRECFVSHPAKVFALRYAADDGRPFCATVEFYGIDNDVHTEGVEGRDLLIRGHAYESLHSDGRTGVSAFGRVRVLTDGILRQKSAWARVENATYLVLLAAVETTMYESNPDMVCKQILDAAEAQGYEALCQAHTEDVCARMERVEFTLGEEQEDYPPTDVRMDAYAANGGNDAAFDALIFQFGRYVLLASSREDSPLPTHMGGIWNDNIYNKQDSTQDMHIDVNVEMQYWPAYPCALAECANPLDNWLRGTLVPAGEKAARQEYGARGWAAHVTSNPWGYASLGWAYNWGSFSFGGAWCATLMWDRFEYSQDKEYLRSVWPILRGSAEFILDYLFWDQKSGYWMTGPSYSPENHFVTNGKQYSLSLSPTCDVILVREMLQIVQKVAEALQLPRDYFFDAVAERLQALPPYQIGGHGQIQEWFHDFEEPIPNHRHTSHLLGLYPFHQITPEETPQLAKAALASMRRRYEDFEITSWGFALFISMYARLYDGDGARRVLMDDVTQLFKPNLTCVMPEDVAMWGGTWELDGNTGLCTALGELLAQSRMAPDQKSYEIRLLPALPSAWPQGKIKGYCLRGGYVLSMEWREGKLVSAQLYSKAGIPFTVTERGEARPCGTSDDGQNFNIG